jgi:hypothetical protein
MFANVLAVDVEVVRVGKVAGVAIGSPGKQHHRRADWNRHAADGGGLGRQSEVAFDGALGSERLLDEVRDASRVVAE